MIKKSSTLISGFLAFGIYFILIALLLFYFNTRNENKPKHYVKKDEHRIQVALSSPQKATMQKEVKKKVEPKPKSKPKPKPIVKPKPKPEVKKKAEIVKKPEIAKKPDIVKKEEVKKKIIEEKVVKKIVKKVVKKKDENLTKPKMVNKPKDLFANISPSPKIEKPRPKLKLEVSDKPVMTQKSNLIKMSDKPSASNLVSNSLKMQKQMDSGVEDAYLAKVQNMLEGWPAQSEYAGEKVKVMLYINPTGFFEFKLKTASGNSDLNEGLTAYLEQLQDIGFGRHKGDSTYHFEAEFIAK
jgi:protein TonB